MSRSVRQWITLIVTILTVLVVDQVTKWVVIQNLFLGQTISPIPAISQFFQITRSENNGAAFGLLPQAGIVFLIVAVIVVLAMVVFFPRIPPNASLTRFAIGLVCGGALGNVLDRVQHGAVIDFIHYQIPGVISNVSNIADHAIVIGVIMILIESWVLDRKDDKPSDETPLEDQPL